MKRVAFFTLGCKVNQYETEAMAEAFENQGYEQVGFHEAADVYVINTCTVTGLSARKSRQAIRRAKQLNRDAIVAAVGCYPQTAREEVEKLAEVDIIAGTADRMKIPAYVEEFRAGRKKSICSRKHHEKPHLRRLKNRMVQGQNKSVSKDTGGLQPVLLLLHHTLCRGTAIRSRPAEDVIREVRKLADGGFKEVVLTGIHIASYGTSQGDIRLLELVNQIHEVDGIDRIRIGSIEPTLVTEEFAETAARLGKLCPHYHISLQSGCDETLKRMNPRYTTAEYKKAVEQLRACIPDVELPRMTPYSAPWQPAAAHRSRGEDYGAGPRERSSSVPRRDVRHELVHLARNARNELRGLAVRRGLSDYRPVWRTTVEQWTNDYAGESLEYYANIRELSRYSLLVGYLGFIRGRPEILDVGCGVGLFRRRLERLEFARYVGVDPAPTAIERARDLEDERTSFVVGEGVPTELGTFDVVVANEVLYLAADPETIIDQVVAAIRPGGSLLTSNWRHATETGLYRLLDERLEGSWTPRSRRTTRPELSGRSGRTGCAAASASAGTARRRRKARTGVSRFAVRELSR